MHSLYTETYFKDEHSGWLVFLHGFGGSTKMWKKQLEPLREQYNLLLLDLPGHGQSKASLTDLGIHRFSDVADLVVDTLKEHGIQKACFLCVSLGTMVFAAIQEKYPDFVSGAVLCGAVAGVDRALRRTLALLDRVKRIFPHAFLLHLFAHILLPLKEHKRSRSFFLESGKRLDRAEFMAWFSLVVRNTEILHTIRPHLKNVLFISGTEDFTFLKGVKRLTRDLTDCSVALLHRCGHVCNLQFPKEFNSLTLRFLNTSVPTSAPAV